MTRTTRRRLLAATGLGMAGLAGCTGFGGPSGAVEGSDGESSGGNGSGGTDGGGSWPPTADARLPLPMSPADLRETAQSGGPPKDGIPSIDDPSFTSADDVDFLSPGDPVFGVVRDGEAKAYPQTILVQHEIVNDLLAGDPVSVTYCPLTGTVQGVRARRHGVWRLGSPDHQQPRDVRPGDGGVVAPDPRDLDPRPLERGPRDRVAV
jgi:hypothetical protein